MSLIAGAKPFCEERRRATLSDQRRQALNHRQPPKEAGMVPGRAPRLRP